MQKLSAHYWEHFGTGENRHHVLEYGSRLRSEMRPPTSCIKLSSKVRRQGARLRTGPLGMHTLLSTQHSPIYQLIMSNGQRRCSAGTSSNRGTFHNSWDQLWELCDERRGRVDRVDLGFLCRISEATTDMCSFD